MAYTMNMTREQEVTAMYARTTARNTANLEATFANCSLTLGEHKGTHCVTGPKYFRTITDTDYRGEQFPA